METFFIRHTRSISLDDQTRKRMWKERRIFIHFPWDKSGNTRRDSKSINPDDYAGGAKKALGMMRRLASEGGYVCAHYAEHDKWMVGFTPPNTRLQKVSGKWKSESRPKGHNGIAIIKTIQLHKSRLVFPHEYAELQPSQPRQGTIMRWPSVGKSIEDIVLGKKRRITLNKLRPDDQEIMCAEFLRGAKARRNALPRLVCTLRDVGRTMKDLDILGIASDGKRIMSQVTHYPLKAAIEKGKLKSLRKYHDHDGNHLLLFCDCEKRTEIDGVTVFPIQEVYEQFCQTPVGKLWKKQI